MILQPKAATRLRKTARAPRWKKIALHFVMKTAKPICPQLLHLPVKLLLRPVPQLVPQLVPHLALSPLLIPLPETLLKPVDPSHLGTEISDP